MNARVIPPVPSEEARYLRTAFLERVTHELRGPAGVTSGALDEIEVALGPNATTLRPYLLMARRGIQRVLRVAARLERTAQLERGTIDWAKMPTDLRALTQEAVKETENLEARRGVCLKVSCSEDECLVLANLDWMRAAIAEIVSNAIRFARSAVSIHTEASADEVTVAIHDDGRGFSQLPVSRFEPPCDKRGVGLSMPLVFDVIAAHGGRIEIEASSTGVDDASSGARVVLVLPRLKKADG